MLRARAAQMPTVLAIVAAKALLIVERRSGFDRLPPSPHISLYIVGVNELSPAPSSLIRSKGSPLNSDPLAVEVIHVALGRRREKSSGALIPP